MIRSSLLLFFVFFLAHAGEISIGAVVPLTGAEATFGQSASRALELAVRRINERGGVRGQSLRLKILDDQGKPEEAALATTRLISQDRVAAILGEITSSATLAMAPIAQANRVPIVTPGATHPRVTSIGDYVFRTCFVDSFQGRLMARYLREQRNVARAAILRDAKSDYAMGLSEAFKNEFAAKGGSVVSEQTYMGGDVDFRAQLTNLRSQKIDFIYVPGYYTDVGLILRQARELGVRTPFAGGDGWDSPKLVEIAGDAAEGGIFSNHYSRDSAAKKTRAFVAEYRKTIGSDPDAIAAATYDAVEVLAQALGRATSSSGPDLRDALLATKKHVGVTGEITLDGKRDPIKSGVILKIEKKAQVYVATVNP